MNNINDLVEMGFIQPKSGRMITLHPMLQEITITDTKPSVTNCHTMLDYLQKEVFCYHGIDVPYYKLLFSTTLNINELIEVDDKDVVRDLCGRTKKIQGVTRATRIL